MSSSAVSAPTVARSDPVRLLYAGTALLALLFTLIGFQQFYLHGRAFPSHPLAPPVRTLLIVHGVAMTTWMALFSVQCLLIVGGNRRLHMTLGPAAVALAGIIVPLGLWLPIQTTRFEPDVVLWGLNRLHFMAVPESVILTFGTFVALGTWHRQRKDVHRPMMLLATLAILPPVFSRIPSVHNLVAGTIWGDWFGPFFPALIVAAAFLGAKTLMTRSFDRWYAWGFAVLVLVDALVMRLAPGATWEHFAKFLVR
jgi:hypothetical protein